jgi:hypothetical protein
MNYREQREIIDRIKIKDGETKRIDCPVCQGKNTFTLTRNCGRKIWNCYKASCSCNGSTRADMSIDSIRKRINEGIFADRKVTTRRPPRELPAVESAVENHPLVMHYLKVNHCLTAHEDNAIKISYDPKSHRVCFYNVDTSGAVGRSLNSDAKPKWLIFGDMTGAVIVGPTDRPAVLVEDVPSACAVYATGVYTGVALLGTNVSFKQKQQLRAFKELLICLDNDASNKALGLGRDLSSVVRSRVVLIKEDFKYLEPANILEVLCHEGKGLGGD